MTISLYSDLERAFITSSVEIEQWLRNAWIRHQPPFYTSVDLRYSGFKLAPVDTNLFPGGFNNLSAECLPLCVHAAQDAIANLCPSAKRVLLIPENHTRNRFYADSVRQLITILRYSGVEVRLGSLLAEIPTLGEGVDFGLPQTPITRQGQRLMVGDFDPCAILLNNDLSAGIPEILRHLDGQILLPPLNAAWAVRRKSHHFTVYQQVADSFARDFSFDPWLISAEHTVCGQVNFQDGSGLECLISGVENLFARIQENYRRHDIKESPFVIIKADAGTYGMGVMTVRSVDDVRHLSRRQRNKMAVIKEGQAVTQVLLQEGVHTQEVIGDAIAEPVVYMMDRFVVGGFMRIHEGRGPDENLNSPGMYFRPMPLPSDCALPCVEGSKRSYSYAVIARLALLAASIELEETTSALAA